MSIDWSKAPEGTTHWGPEQTSGASSYVECWFKIEDGTVKSYCCADMVEDGWHRYNGHMPEERKLALVERHAAWTGAGLPPVGTVCQTERNEFLRRVEILCIGEHRVFVRDEHGEEIALLLEGREFLPIRTQAQIEADEREKAVKVMLDLDPPHESGFGLTSRKTFCETLYDAGYRKQPKEGA